MRDHDLAALGGSGIVKLQYPAELRPYVDAFDVAWKRFYALPEAVKRTFPYSGDENLSGVGYQGPEDGCCDPKEHFHLSLEMEPWLLGHAHAIGNPVITEFIEAGLELLRRLEPYIARFSESCEREFAIPGIARDIMARMRSHVLRALHYLKGSIADAIIAKSHLDKGTGTLHLKESNPGFEYYDAERDVWVGIEFTAGETVIIAGFRMQNRSECRIKAVDHRVIATEETAEEGRDSIVLFLDDENSPYYDKERLGSMQQFKTGFFMHMSYEELKTFFKPAV